MALADFHWTVALTVAFALVSLPAPAPAQQLPPGFTAVPVASGLSRPTAMALAPDGRIFVAEQGGRLRVIKEGRLLPRAFVRVNVDDTGERGLLGVAFDPAFDSNGFVYVYYTATSPAVHNRVVRFTADGDVAVTGSDVLVLRLEDLFATNHNGGAIHFGPDGKLYVAVGENDRRDEAQSFDSRLGKILRINRNGSIPSDNPFLDRTTGPNRAIWALGLRNPFTFAFDRNTGRMQLNDVGENTWEEVNLGVAGANYGWPIYEGPESDPRYRPPLYAYDHDEGCAITGAAFYDPETVRYPASYVGDYFFADLCGGWIRRFNVANGAVATFAEDLSTPVDLAVSGSGFLFYLERGTGSVSRVRFDP